MTGVSLVRHTLTTQTSLMSITTRLTLSIDNEIRLLSLPPFSLFQFVLMAGWVTSTQPPPSQSS